MTRLGLLLLACCGVQCLQMVCYTGDPDSADTTANCDAAIQFCWRRHAKGDKSTKDERRCARAGECVQDRCEESADTYTCCCNKILCNSASSTFAAYLGLILVICVTAVF